MELIQKTVYRIMTTGTTAPCSHRNPETGALITGCTAMTLTIIPNTGVTYNFKILLNQEVKDAGFFDAYMLDSPFDYIQLSGATSADTIQNLIKFKSVLTGGTTLVGSGLAISGGSGYIIGTDEYWSGGTLITPSHNYIVTGTSYWSGGTWVSLIINSTRSVTGHSSSRLMELRKYVVSGTTAQIYITGGTSIIDGIVLAQSTGNTIVYFLGGIRYVDILTGDTSGTTFNFITSGYTNNPNFIIKPIYQNPNKENIISNPKISNDVFIIRQELPAFDGNYRLEYIRKLVDLETYAAGKFFNVINNT